ncbi:ADP-ribosylation/Crystallin J1 [Reticulomyxa filosa]|uniref:ADP-ribosylation/Crystallin J1 n=1 Tax=Reticulomyxa filosa TaxID=46433 RepID=X6PCA4_RETFI|nr:ADP-ribosylation/Crystallin J1 [Reticulomyxa filosa]|eukprot:ETO35297.1 ADP-ribosylation/Crystallin J1 [Reticulomyxa filosa]
MPFIYGYFQFDPKLTFFVAVLLFVLNIILFSVSLSLEKRPRSELAPQIWLNFLSPQWLWISYGIVCNPWKKMYRIITNHELWDMWTALMFCEGLLAVLVALLLPYSTNSSNLHQILMDHPFFFYVTFVYLYIQVCVQAIYFIIVSGIILTDYILGCACFHTSPSSEIVTTDPFQIDFVYVQINKYIYVYVDINASPTPFGNVSDLELIKQKYGVSGVVTLVPMNELTLCGCEKINEEAKDLELNWMHYPWRDKFIPHNSIQHLYTFLHTVCLPSVDQQNQKVLIHCNGGVGRTGTFVACLIMTIAYHRPDLNFEQFNIHTATRLMRASRKSSMLKNPLQRMFVNCFFSSLKLGCIAGHQIIQPKLKGNFLKIYTLFCLYSNWKLISLALIIFQFSLLSCSFFGKYLKKKQIHKVFAFRQQTNA